jgi:hypothetical protein
MPPRGAGGPPVQRHRRAGTSRAGAEDAPSRPIMILTTIDRAACLRRPQCDAVVGEQRCHRGVLATVGRPFVFPITTASHPGPGPPARPPGPRPADAAPTPAPGSARSQRTPPRSSRAGPPTRPPAPAAAPARSPDPASPPSTPARKRDRAPALPLSPTRRPGQYVSPTPPAHRWLHPDRARRPGQDAAAAADASRRT